MALKLKNAIAQKAKENKIEAANKMNANVGNNVSTEICENVKPIDTQKELAKVAGVSHRYKERAFRNQPEKLNPEHSTHKPFYRLANSIIPLFPEKCKPERKLFYEKSH